MFFLFPFLLCASVRSPTFRFSTSLFPRAHQPLAAISSGSPFAPFFPPLPSSPLSLHCASPLPPRLNAVNSPASVPLASANEAKICSGPFFSLSIFYANYQGWVINTDAGNHVAPLGPCVIVRTHTYTHTNTNVHPSRAYGLFNLHTTLDSVCI